MNKDNLSGAPYQKIPERKRGKVIRRRNEDGQPMAQCRDWEGKWIWVKVPKIEYHEISEAWSTFYWFIYQTSNKPVAPNALRNEQLALAEAMAQSRPAMMPVERRVVRRRDPETGKRLRTGDHYDRLMFENYILIGFGRNDLWDFYDHHRRLCDCKHIEGVLASGDKPIWVDDKMISRLIREINDGDHDESKNNPEADDSIKIKDLVQIMDGPFDRFTGTVKKVFQQSDGRERWISGAEIELNIFGRSTNTSLPIDSLQRVWVEDKK